MYVRTAVLAAAVAATAAAAAAAPAAPASVAVAELFLKTFFTEERLKDRPIISWAHNAILAIYTITKKDTTKKAEALFDFKIVHKIGSRGQIKKISF